MAGDRWAPRRETIAKVSYSGYNQVFQELLNPAGLLGTNHGGVNVLLVRPSDWWRTGEDHREAPIHGFSFPVA